MDIISASVNLSEESEEHSRGSFYCLRQCICCYNQNICRKDSESNEEHVTETGKM